MPVFESSPAIPAGAFLSLRSIVMWVLKFIGARSQIELHRYRTTSFP
jgi:hypothetical protein